MVFQRGVEKRSGKLEERGPKMSVFWVAGSLKVVLSCRRREHFAKTGCRGSGHENDPKWEPKWLPKWS